jgi:C7-cyclitol 7-kinase
VTRLDRTLVFDVGGTQLRGAVYDAPSGSLSAFSRADAPSYLRHKDASWRELHARLIDAMSSIRSQLDPGGNIRSAVVAFPGPVDAERRVLAAPPLWGTLGEYPCPLERDLRDAWRGVDVRLVNDVTAAGYRYIEGDDDDFCLVAVSTGIGNKVFARGRPMLGRAGNGGEIGHLQVDPSPTAPACDCGARGHLAAIASGRGSLARARERSRQEEEAFGRSALSAAMGLGPDTLTAEALADAYRGGDAWAATVVREGAAALGLVFAAIHLATGVDRFVLIGGFAQGLGARFCDDVRAALRGSAWHSTSTRVLLGNADGHCALLGAGRAAHLGLLP